MPSMFLVINVHILPKHSDRICTSPTLTPTCSAASSESTLATCSAVICTRSTPAPLTAAVAGERPETSLSVCTALSVGRCWKTRVGGRRGRRVGRRLRAGRRVGGWSSRSIIGGRAGTASLLAVRSTVPVLPGVAQALADSHEAVASIAGSDEHAF